MAHMVHKKKKNSSEKLDNTLEVWTANIEQSLHRLAAQVEKYLVLPICEVVKVTFGKRPIARENVSSERTVNISELSHVYVGLANQDEGQVKVVRLIFGDMLFAVVGKSAETLISWAESVANKAKHVAIESFPGIAFQFAGRVRVLNGEILPA